MVAENKLPGTTAWKIPPHSGPDGIEGFANLGSAAVGTQITLYVSTAATSFRVVAYRMGWYQGKGARLVWASGTIAAARQPACPLTPGINLVSCANWHRSFRSCSRRAFVQGDYLFKLVAGGRTRRYVPLTVWDPTSHATYLIMNRTFTEEGWNAFGGYSYYQGVGPCTLGSPGRTRCATARAWSPSTVPTTPGTGSDFLGDEYPLIRYCEEHGLDVAYVTDVTVDEHPLARRQPPRPAVARPRRVVVLPRALGLADAERKGINVIFFGRGLGASARPARAVAARGGPPGGRLPRPERGPAQRPRRARWR